MCHSIPFLAGECITATILNMCFPGVIRRPPGEGPPAPGSKESGAYPQGARDLAPAAAALRGCLCVSPQIARFPTPKTVHGGLRRRDGGVTPRTRKSRLKSESNMKSETKRRRSVISCNTARQQKSHVEVSDVISTKSAYPLRLCVTIAFLNTPRPFVFQLAGDLRIVDLKFLSSGRAFISRRTKAPALPDPGRACRLTVLQEGPDLVLVGCCREMATSAGKYFPDPSPIHPPRPRTLAYQRSTNSHLPVNGVLPKIDTILAPFSCVFYKRKIDTLQK